MDPNDRHTEPFSEAADQAGQRIAQLIALAATVRQVRLQQRLRRERRQELRDRQQEAAAAEHQRLAREEARIGWAPAYDKQWLHDADLLATARVWSAAIPYADSDTEAVGAVRRCEERLRHLHPAAMRHYDGLRAQGLVPEVAMEQAAPRFAGHPDPRIGDAAKVRPSIAPTSPAAATDLRLVDYPAGVGPSKLEFQLQRQHGAAHRIVDRLQGTAAKAGRGPLQPGELRTALEVLTNLPDEVLDQVAPVAHSPRNRPPNPDDPAAMAAADFPVSLQQVMATPADQLAPGATEPARSRGNTPDQGLHLRR